LHGNLEAFGRERARTFHRFAGATDESATMKRTLDSLSAEFALGERSGAMCAQVGRGKKFVTDTLCRHRRAVFQCYAAHRAIGYFVDATDFNQTHFYPLSL